MKKDEIQISFAWATDANYLRAVRYIAKQMMRKQVSGTKKTPRH